MYIPIRKVDDQEFHVDFSYGIDDQQDGVLRVQKGTGDISIIRPASGDERLAIYMRAARKMKQHWLKGEYPESTCWAS